MLISLEKMQPGVNVVGMGFYPLSSHYAIWKPAGERAHE
jgi:hypothetical protein